MKTTGVVRRIDDLGRIVIPKEIRRTLRIRDGESLEIFVDNDTISLKKFSSLTEFTAISEDLCEACATVMKKYVMITDTDKVIATGGGLKNNFINKNISKNMERLIRDREKVIYNNVSVEILDGHIYDCSYLAYPIIFGGDVFGLVIIFSYDDNIDNNDERMASIIKNFLEKNIEG